METVDSFENVISNRCVFNYIDMLFLISVIFELLLCVGHKGRGCLYISLFNLYNNLIGKEDTIFICLMGKLRPG